MKRSPAKITVVKNRTVPAGVFKAKCLALMDEVQRKNESIVVTKRGKPIVRVAPVAPEADDFYGFLRDKVTIRGDIVSPIIGSDEWELD